MPTLQLYDSKVQPVWLEGEKNPDTHNQPQQERALSSDSLVSFLLWSQLAKTNKIEILKLSWKSEH